MIGTMMDYEIKAFAPYWVDGMKVGAKEFSQLNNFILAWLEASFMATNGGGQYGLIPHAQFELKATQDNTLCLSLCQAITPSGRRVEITEHTSELHLPKPLLARPEQEEVDLVVEVSPLSQDPTAFGSPQGAGNPHFPYSIYAYQLKAIDTDTPPGIHQLKVGEWRNKKLNQDYIPPCLAMNSHPKLKELGNTIEANWDEIWQQAQKVNKTYQESTIPLQVEARNLVRRLMPELFTTHTHLKTQSGTLSPRAFFLLFASWPVRLEIAWRDGTYPKQLIKTLMAESLNEQSLQHRLDEAKQLQFDIDNIHQSMSRLEEPFLRTFKTLIKELLNSDMKQLHS